MPLTFLNQKKCKKKSKLEIERPPLVHLPYIYIYIYIYTARRTLYNVVHLSPVSFSFTSGFTRLFLFSLMLSPSSLVRSSRPVSCSIMLRAVALFVAAHTHPHAYTVLCHDSPLVVICAPRTRSRICICIPRMCGLGCGRGCRCRWYRIFKTDDRIRAQHITYDTYARNETNSKNETARRKTKM